MQGENLKLMCDNCWSTALLREQSFQAFLVNSRLKIFGKEANNSDVSSRWAEASLCMFPLHQRKKLWVADRLAGWSQRGFWKSNVSPWTMCQWMRKSLMDMLLMIWSWCGEQTPISRWHYSFRDGCELEGDLCTEQPGALEVEDNMRLT